MADPTTLREALIVEALGEAARLIRQVEALAPVLDESCQALLQAEGGLRDRLTRSTAVELARPAVVLVFVGCALWIGAGRPEGKNGAERCAGRRQPARERFHTVAAPWRGAQSSLGQRRPQRSITARTRASPSGISVCRSARPQRSASRQHSISSLIAMSTARSSNGSS